jgi:hypothetical protein
MFPCGLCFLSHPFHQGIRPGRLLPEERAIGGLFPDETGDAIRSEQSFSVILGGCFTPGFIRMDTMHKGTAWSETVPFWACLSAIWQVVPDDASNTSLLALSIITRSTRRYVGSQLSAFTSMHSDD